MNPNEDDELEAMLAEAEVKEDYLDLGMPGQVSGTASVPDSPARKESRKLIGTAANGKKYKVKSVNGRSNMCLSYIGSGATFCLRVNCPTNHGSASEEGSQVFEPPEEGVLVILKNAQVAFAAPVLRASSVESDVAEDWEGQSFAFEDWQQMFRASNQGKNVVMSFQDIKLEVDATRNVESFRTPAKRKKVTILEPDMAFEGYSKVLTSPQAQSQFKRAANSASLADSIVGLDTALGSLSLGVERLFEGSVVAIREVESVADMAYRKSMGLENTIGSSQLMGDSEYAHPTLWGSLATIGMELTSMRNAKPPPALDLGPFRAEVKRSQEGLVTSMTKISSFTRAFSKSLLTRVAGLEEETKRIRKMVEQSENQNQPVDEFDSLLAEAGAQGRTNHRATDVGLSRIEKLEATVERVLAANESLEQRFAQVISENEADAIKFAGLGLRSLEETAAWVESHFPKRAYGLIFDVYLLFDLIADEGAVTQKDLMTEMKRREELDIATEAEGQALTAFLCEVPRLFHSTSGTLALLADNASHLSKVPTHKAWANGTGGLKKTIEKKLSRLKSSLREVLGIELGAGTVAYSVAVEALEKSISWIGSFLSFIDQTYESLHVQSNFSSPRAWALTTQLGRRIFADLHSVRVGTTKAMGKGRRAICPVILWSVFRTHDKMAAFEIANFEDHPSIASEYVKFLATNSGLEVVTKLEEEVVSLKGKVKEVEKQSNGAAVKADKASSAVDLVKKQSDALAKKVAGL
jgi:hypothetical protein